jgi:hypothetical protein
MVPETLVDFQPTTRHYIPEDRTLQKKCCKSKNCALHHINKYYVNRRLFPNTAVTTLPLSTISVATCEFTVLIPSTALCFLRLPCRQMVTIK